MRSAARKSGRLSPTSASITPTSVTPGKSSPLAIIWVPSRMSTSCRRHARGCARAPTCRRSCPRPSGRCRAAGEGLAHARARPARCRAAEKESSLGAARGAAFGHCRLPAAVVADEPPPPPVPGERDVAGGTRGDPPAGPALQNRGVASPVEEQERLAPRSASRQVDARASSSERMGARVSSRHASRSPRRRAPSPDRPGRGTLGPAPLPAGRSVRRRPPIDRRTSGSGCAVARSWSSNSR